MQQFGENIIIGLSTGLVSGLVTGLYSGLVISRRNRFDSLRAGLLRHVSSIEYIQEPGRVAIQRGSSAQVLFVAGELAHFGHRLAAEAALAGNRIVVSALYDAEHGTIDAGILEARLDEARDTFRSIRPSVKTYFPWGQV